MVAVWTEEGRCPGDGSESETDFPWERPGTSNVTKTLRRSVKK